MENLEQRTIELGPLGLFPQGKPLMPYRGKGCAALLGNLCVGGDAFLDGGFHGLEGGEASFL